MTPTQDTRQNSRWIWLVVAGLAAVGLFPALVTGGGDGDGGGGEVVLPPVDGEVGEWVDADGDLSVRVDELACGRSSHSVGFGGSEPDGEFCVLAYRVENVGDDAARLDDPTVVDVEGRRHSVDARSRRLDEVNPGQTVEVDAAFDVASGVEPVGVEVEGVFVEV